MIALVPVYPVVSVWCLTSCVPCHSGHSAQTLSIFSALSGQTIMGHGDMSQAWAQTILLLFSVVQSISVHNSLGDQMPGNIVAIVTSGILSGGGAGISYKHCKHHNNHRDNAMWGLTRVWPWGQHCTITPAPAAGPGCSESILDARCNSLWCRYDECDPRQCWGQSG